MIPVIGLHESEDRPAEQKAEMAWSSYRYLRLVEPSQIARHEVKRAFAWLLDVVRDPTSHTVNLKARPVGVEGAILVWGAITADGRAAAIETFGFADVLSLETMIADLREWQDSAWQLRVDERSACFPGALVKLSGNHPSERTMKSGH